MRFFSAALVVLGFCYSTYAAQPVARPSTAELCALTNVPKPVQNCTAKSIPYFEKGSSNPKFGYFIDVDRGTIFHGDSGRPEHVYFLYTNDARLLPFVPSPFPWQCITSKLGGTNTNDRIWLQSDDEIGKGSNALWNKRLYVEGESVDYYLLGSWATNGRLLLNDACEGDLHLDAAIMSWETARKTCASALKKMDHAAATEELTVGISEDMLGLYYLCQYNYKSNESCQQQINIRINSEPNPDPVYAYIRKKSPSTLRVDSESGLSYPRADSCP